MTLPVQVRVAGHRLGESLLRDFCLQCSVTMLPGVQHWTTGARQVDVGRLLRHLLASCLGGCLRADCSRRPRGRVLTCIEASL